MQFPLLHFVSFIWFRALKLFCPSVLNKSNQSCSFPLQISDFSQNKKQNHFWRRRIPPLLKIFHTFNQKCKEKAAEMNRNVYLCSKCVDDVPLIMIVGGIFPGLAPASLLHHFWFSGSRSSTVHVWFCKRLVSLLNEIKISYFTVMEICWSVCLILL